MLAKKLTYFFLPAFLCLVSCKNTQSGDKIKGANNELKGEWYKHYSGTIADQPVVVNLHHYGDITVGSYYYSHKSVIIDLLAAEDVADKFTIHFNEFVRTRRAVDEDNYQPDRWSVNISDGEMNGKWTSGDNSKTYAIDLKEDYPAGTYAMDIIVHGDSTTASKGMTATTAVSLYELLQPKGEMKKDEVDFFSTTELRLLGGDTLNAKNIADYIQKEDKKYFLNYNKLIKDIKVNKESSEDWQYNFYHSRNMWVLYNEHNFLSVQLYDYDYSGGGSGHGNSWSAYSCIDMQQKKVWRLDDILNVDPTLIPILNEEVRNVFKIGPGDTLSNRLNTDQIALTDNVFISGQGITFCYYPGEIGVASDGEICLFIPYTKIYGMLKDDFKKRMKL